MREMPFLVVEGIAIMGFPPSDKEAPRMIYMAMRKFGITDAAKVLKAGDSEIDIEEGKNSGCGIIVGVLSGAQKKEQFEAASPDYILKDVTELKNILCC